MDQDIKMNYEFHGKRLDNSEYICGSLIEEDEASYITPVGRSACFEVDPKSVAVFTGFFKGDGTRVYFRMVHPT